MSDVSAKRGVILDVAARLFARYGFRKTSVADIIREAGVARATVYKYFPTKEEIFYAVIRREMQDMLHTVGEAVEKESTTRGRLRAVAVTYSEEIRRSVNLYRLTMDVLSNAIPRGGDEVDGMAREASKVYERILSEGVRSGEIVVDDIETASWTVMLAFEGIFIMTVTGQIEERITSVIDTLLDIIWDGLKPREEAV